MNVQNQPFFVSNGGPEFCRQDPTVLPIESENQPGGRGFDWSEFGEFL